jgi:hypothetical protein
MKILDVPQSGSVAGQTSSRNRFGQYRRTRAVPVNPNTSFQVDTRGRLTDLSQAWRTLSSGQRAGWADLGAQMSRTDSLGQTYNLTGLQAYVSVNSLNLAAGNAAVDDAPGLSEPGSLATVTPTIEDTPTMSFAYTVTPLGANQKLFAFLGPQRSAGRSFESDLRLMKVGAAAGVSPLSVLTEYTARFGTPVLGNRIFWSLQIYDAGFLSAPQTGSTVVS